MAKVPWYDMLWAKVFIIRPIWYLIMRYWGHILSSQYPLPTVLGCCKASLGWRSGYTLRNLAFLGFQMLMVKYSI
jgi:hypothetical protein